MRWPWWAQAAAPDRRAGAPVTAAATKITAQVRTCWGMPGFLEGLRISLLNAPGRGLSIPCLPQVIGRPRGGPDALVRVESLERDGFDLVGSLQVVQGRRVERVERHLFEGGVHPSLRAFLRAMANESFLSSCALRPDDTEALHSQGEQATARERHQAGSCQPAMMDVINLTVDLRYASETRDHIHACLALQWDETKDQTPLERRVGRKHEDRRQIWWLSPDDRNWLRFPDRYQGIGIIRPALT